MSEVNLTRPPVIGTPEATSDTPTQVHRVSARRLASPYALQCNTCESTNRARTHSIILREALAEHTGVLHTQPIRNNYIGRSTRIAGEALYSIVVENAVPCQSLVDANEYNSARVAL